MQTPEPTPCPLCQATRAQTIIFRGEPLIWFTCQACGYSWSIRSPESMDATGVARLVRDLIAMEGFLYELVAVGDGGSAWQIALKDPDDRVLNVEIEKDGPERVRAAIR